MQSKSQKFAPSQTNSISITPSQINHHSLEW
jgi:hypothetical protein